MEEHQVSALIDVNSDQFIDQMSSAGGGTWESLNYLDVYREEEEVWPPSWAALMLCRLEVIS